MSRSNYLKAFYDEETGCYEYLPHRRGGGRAMVTDDWFPPGTTEARPAADLGFHFTDGERDAIRRAGLDAAEYMKSYGRGRAPYLIDTRRYHNSRPAPLPEPPKEDTGR